MSKVYGYLRVSTNEQDSNSQKFDDFLHYHGNYENEGFSMETLIEKKYGKEALDFSLEAFGLKYGK